MKYFTIHPERNLSNCTLNALLAVVFFFLTSIQLLAQPSPSISTIPNQETCDGQTIAAISFTLSGDVNATLSASDDNSGINPTYTFGGSGANRTITIATVPGQIGATTVTITAVGGGGTTTQTFLLECGIRTVNNNVVTTTTVIPSTNNLSGFTFAPNGDILVGFGNSTGGVSSNCVRRYSSSAVLLDANYISTPSQQSQFLHTDFQGNLVFSMGQSLFKYSGQTLINSKSFVSPGVGLAETDSVGNIVFLNRQSPPAGYIGTLPANFNNASTPVTITGGLNGSGFSDFGLDNNRRFIYYMDIALGKVYKVSPNGATTTEILSTSLPRSFAFDPFNVMWVSHNGQLSKLDANGVLQPVVASGFFGVQMKFDANGDLYFMEGSGSSNTLKKLDLNTVVTYTACNAKPILSGAASADVANTTVCFTANNSNLPNRTINVSDTDGTIASTTVSSSNSSLVAVTNAGTATNVVLNLTQQGGQSGTSVIKVVSTDNLGAKDSVQFTITVLPVQTPTSTVTQVSCFGGSNGAINLTPAGGTAPYTFNWGGGITTEDRTGLAAGVYSVTITDNNGCSVQMSATVSQPTALSPTASVSSNYNGSQISCNGAADGVVSVTVSGGVFPYTYLWSNGQTSQANSGLAAGTYTVVVTDANSCSITSNAVVVTEPASLATSTFATTPTSCFGGNDGAINVSPAGGTGVYTFSWSDGTSTEDRLGIIAGTYVLTISDVNGCSTSINSTVSEPVAIVSSVSATACESYSLNGQTYNASGTYTQNLTAVNGCDSTLTLNLNILSASGNSITATDCEMVTVNGTTYTSSGTYTQVLTNANGCDSILTIDATVLMPTFASISLSDCDSLTINGETFMSSGIYTQVFTNAAGCDSILTINLTINSSIYDTLSVNACGEYTLNGETFTSTGIYNQVLVAANGCPLYQTIDVTIYPLINVTAVYNGDSTFTATGADTYQWIDCILGLPIDGATSANFTATNNGDYAVIGTSMNGCSDTTECISVDNLSVQDNTAMNWSIYPNPTNDLITIQFNGSTAFVSVRDAQGKLLQTTELESGTQVNLAPYQPGIYFIELRTGYGTQLTRVVKQ
ncbi:MAG: T9SS type A sorting domain-containing protein [Fluviicola sp.]